MSGIFDLLTGLVWGWYLYFFGESIPAQSLSLPLLFFAAVFVIILTSAIISYRHFGTSEFLFDKWLFLTSSMASGVVLLAVACVVEGNNLGALPVLLIMFSIPFYCFSLLSHKLEIKKA